MQYTYYWLMSGVNYGTISVLMIGKELQPCILETPRILECMAVYLTIAVSLSHYKIQYSWFLYKPGVKKRNLIVFCLSNVDPHAKFFCIFSTLFHIRLTHRIFNTIPYKAHTPHFFAHFWHYSIPTTPSHNSTWFGKFFFAKFLRFLYKAPLVHILIWVCCMLA